MTKSRSSRRQRAGALTLRAVFLALAFTTTIPAVSIAGERAGIGRSSAAPEGNPHRWPDGLIAREPFEHFDEDHCYPEAQTDRPRLGLGAGVALCMGFANTTDAPIQVRLPAGLIMVSFDTENQNGLLIQTETFEVPPGDAPFFVSLRLFCLNAGRAPSSFGDIYGAGPVTEDAPISALVRMLSTRTITEDDIPVLQNALWNVTDYEGLRPEDTRALAALPIQGSLDDVTDRETSR